MNYEEQSINYLREEIEGEIHLNKRYIEGDGVPEKEARERYLGQQWIKVLDRECREARRRGEANRDLVVDAENRIAAHNKRVHKREPVLGAMYEEHVSKYKLVLKGYDKEYVTADNELPYGKLQHLMTHDERWASLP